MWTVSDVGRRRNVASEFGFVEQRNSQSSPRALWEGVSGEVVVEQQPPHDELASCRQRKLHLEHTVSVGEFVRIGGVREGEEAVEL